MFMEYKIPKTTLRAFVDLLKSLGRNLANLEVLLSSKLQEISYSFLGASKDQDTSEYQRNYELFSKRIKGTRELENSIEGLIYNLSSLDKKYIDNFATDCGNWDIEIINEQDRKFHFGGSLCTDLVYRQEALSLLLREFIEMPELLGFDGDIRNEIHVDEGEYIFVEVSFESSEKTYCYICDDKLIQEYDEVLVPVGQDNIEKIAIVESVDVHTEDDAPYPVEKCKASSKKYTELIK